MMGYIGMLGYIEMPPRNNELAMTLG